MLGFHKIHLTTYQTGGVINIFASVKFWPWLRPWYQWKERCYQSIGKQIWISSEVNVPVGTWIFLFHGWIRAVVPNRGAIYNTQGCFCIFQYII